MHSCRCRRFETPLSGAKCARERILLLDLLAVGDVEGGVHVRAPERRRRTTRECLLTPCGETKCNA
jgi:hypothetical protein